MPLLVEYLWHRPVAAMEFLLSVLSFSSLIPPDQLLPPSPPLSSHIGPRPLIEYVLLLLPGMILLPRPFPEYFLLYLLLLLCLPPLFSPSLPLLLYLLLYIPKTRL